MKTFWKKRASSETLILFVNGFSMDSHPLDFLAAERSDVAILSDFSDLNVPDNLVPALLSYKTVRAIAWSLGVWVFKQIVRPLFDRFERTVAINGTLHPIHKDWGIAPDVFEATKNNFDDEGRTLFYRNLFGRDAGLERFLQCPPQRSSEDQKRELVKLQAAIMASDSSRAEPSELPFDAVLVGKHDRIVPFRSQERFWERFLIPHVLDAPHFPFYRWTKWEDIFDE